MFVILMGAQGSGKGTQAALLGPKHKLVRVATGDLFRAAIAGKSELGLQVEAILARGDLVPDDVTNSIVRERLASIAEERHYGDAVKGALFDGFPRTEAQARALDDILDQQGEKVTAVIEIDVPRDTLIERLSGRRVCVECGAVYQLRTSPPRVDGVCDIEAGRLTQRADDMPDAIARRLALYDEQTAPLVSYYTGRGLLTKVDGDQPVNRVTEAIDTLLSAKRAS